MKVKVSRRERFLAREVLHPVKKTTIEVGDYVRLKGDRLPGLRGQVVSYDPDWVIYYTVHWEDGVVRTHRDKGGCVKAWTARMMIKHPTAKPPFLMPPDHT